MKIEELEILINANADQFRRELADVKKGLGTLETTATGVSSKMGGSLFSSVMAANLGTQVLLGTVKQVGRAFFNLGSKVVNLGTQYTRLKVATDTVTRNMGMSREETNKLRDSLEDANTYGSRAEEVIKTLAMSGLVDMAKGLDGIDARSGKVVYGVEALVLAMKDLGAAAGIDSADAITRLTKFIRTGNQSFADGIIELGNMRYAYEKYAQSIGKTGTQLLETERATARVTLMMDEADKALGAYANTMQTAGKAMGSIRDASISIYERLGGYLEPLFASVARAVFLFVDGVRQSLIANAQTFRDWASKVAGYVVAVVRIIGSLLARIPKIGQNFIALKEFALKPVANALDTLNDKVGGTSGAMKDATKSTKALKKELLGLAGFDEMNVLRPPSDTSSGGTGGVEGVGVGSLDMKDLFNEAELNESTSRVNEWADRIGIRFEELKEKITSSFTNMTEDLNLATITELFDTVLSDVSLTIEKWGPNIKGNFGLLFENIKKDYFDRYVKIYKTIWADFTDSLLSNWQEYGKGMLDSIGEWIANLGGTLNKLWTDILNPIIQPFLDALENAWENSLKGAMDEVLGFVLVLQDFTMTIWNKVIFPIINWLIDKLSPAFTRIGKTIGLTVETLLTVIGFVIQGIIGGFKGLLGFITNVLKGDWEKAWISLRDGFNTSLGAIVGIGKTIINHFIRTINNMIAELNKIKVPDWVPAVGGKGFSIKPLKQLATGGVVQSPTIAMLGEAGKEVVLPLENNTEWMKELADQLGGRSGNMNLTVKIGEDTIFEKAIDYINDKSLITGMNVLNI